METIVAFAGIISLFGFFVFLFKYIRAKKANDPANPAGRYLKRTLICLVVLVVAFVVTPDKKETDSDETPSAGSTTEVAATAGSEIAVEESAEHHIYDNAELIDIKNGYGTETIGQCSVVHAASEDLTDEALNDWYINYVKKHEDCKWHVIVYTDKEGYGVYCGSGMIIKNVKISDDYSYEDSLEAVGYLEEDGHLVRQEPAFQIDNTDGTVDADELIDAVRDITSDSLGEGEEFTDINFDEDSRCLSIDVDIPFDEDSAIPAKDIEAARVSSITDEILKLGSEYYNTWETISVSFANEDKIVLNKAMIRNSGYGYYFEFTTDDIEGALENAIEMGRWWFSNINWDTVFRYKHKIHYIVDYKCIETPEEFSEYGDYVGIAGADLQNGFGAEFTSHVYIFMDKSGAAQHVFYDEADGSSVEIPMDNIGMDF